MNTVDQAIETIVAEATSEQRKTLITLLDEKCGGPGSGVPGPCPRDKPQKPSSGDGTSKPDSDGPEEVSSKYALSYEYHKDRKRLDRPAAKKEMAKAGIGEQYAITYQGGRGNTSVPYNVSSENIRKTLVDNGYKHTKTQTYAEGEGRERTHVKYDGFENAKGVRVTTMTIQPDDFRYGREQLNRMPWVDVSKPKKVAKPT